MIFNIMYFCFGKLAILIYCTLIFVRGYLYAFIGIQNSP